MDLKCSPPRWASDNYYVLGSVHDDNRDGALHTCSCVLWGFIRWLCGMSLPLPGVHESCEWRSHAVGNPCNGLYWARAWPHEMCFGSDHPGHGVRSTLCSTVRFYRKLDQFLIVPSSPLKTKVQEIQVPGDSLNRNPVDLGVYPHTSDQLHWLCPIL